jgi:hypothetical protein
MLCCACRLLAELSDTMAFCHVDMFTYAFLDLEACDSRASDSTYNLDAALKDPWLLAVLTAALWCPAHLCRGSQYEGDGEKLELHMLDKLRGTLDAAWVWVRERGRWPIVFLVVLLGWWWGRKGVAGQGLRKTESIASVCGLRCAPSYSTLVLRDAYMLRNVRS